MSLFSFLKNECLFLLSTSKGLMTDKFARFFNIGGEVLFSIWFFLFFIWLVVLNFFSFL